MVKASSLKYVPLDPFADEEGIPFSLNSHTAASYLSLRYPVWAVEATTSIGLSHLSPREFLGDLNSAIIKDSTTFRTRSLTWHSQLAETLVKLTNNTELMSVIQDICLIPLHDGNWTSARGQTIFLSKSDTPLEIPSGIEVLIVDSSAESDPNRRKLFMSLGVKAWEAPEICRLILRIHESSDFEPEKLTVDQLISHAAFLYKASWQPPKTADLWFATMQDKRCRGRKLYIPGSIEKDSPAARIFSQLQKHYAVIHNDYVEAFALDADWPIWLVSNLGLSMVPRLITPQVNPKPQPTQTLELHEDATLPEGFEVDSLFGDDDFMTQNHENGTVLDEHFDFFDEAIRRGSEEDNQIDLIPSEQQNKKILLTTGRKQQTPSSSMMLPIMETQEQQRLAQHQQQANRQRTPKASKPKSELPIMILSMKCD